MLHGRVFCFWSARPCCVHSPGSIPVWVQASAWSYGERLLLERRTLPSGQRVVAFIIGLRFDAKTGYTQTLRRCEYAFKWLSFEIDSATGGHKTNSNRSVQGVDRALVL